MRRLLWSWTFYVGGPARVRRSGTFFLTTIAGQGAEIQHPPAFLTANATYGPIDENGKSRVTIAYDHRLMDGRLVAARAGRHRRGPVRTGRGRAGIDLRRPTSRIARLETDGLNFDAPSPPIRASRPHGAGHRAHRPESAWPSRRAWPPPGRTS